MCWRASRAAASPIAASFFSRVSAATVGIAACVCTAAISCLLQCSLAGPLLGLDAELLRLIGRTPLSVG